MSSNKRHDSRERYKTCPKLIQKIRRSSDAEVSESQEAFLKTYVTWKLSVSASLIFLFVVIFVSLFEAFDMLLIEKTNLSAENYKEVSIILI